MLQYKNFTFDSKQDFLNYIENRMIKYWKAHNDSFSAVCEELDSYDGFLGDNRVYPMDELDDLLGDKKPSEVLQMVDSDFNYSDNYFYFDGCGFICSTDEKEYYNDFDYSDVFEKLIDDYGHIFSHNYGDAYFELFNDVDSINSWDEEEIQDYLNDGYYDYLFEDNGFFSDDDLDDWLRNKSSFEFQKRFTNEKR